MIKTQPYLEIMLSGGQNLVVKGANVDDVPIDLVNRFEWVTFEQMNGKIVQVWSEDISAVVEREFVDIEVD